MTGYPTRQNFFAAKFIRLLTKTAAAMEIGTDGAWLLTIIAQQEDSKRYTGPVTYWNEQLFSLMGCGSKKPLVKAREKCVKAGWLHYESGGKSKPGRYWVTTPAAYEGIPDGPCDESSDDLGVPNGTTNGTDKSVLGCQMEPTMERQRNGNGSPFIPIPIPNPKREAAPQSSFDPLKIEIPQAINTHKMREAWADWVAHRKEIRKPLKATQAGKQLRKFEEWGVTRAVRAIDHTITQGWQGIREPEPNAAQEPEISQSSEFKTKKQIQAEQRAESERARRRSS